MIEAVTIGRKCAFFVDGVRWIIHPISERSAEELRAPLLALLMHLV